MNHDSSLHTQEYDSLVSSAIAALERAYVKSNDSTRYAAAVLAEGEIYEGVSLHSRTHSQNIHAEMAAISHAISHGKRKISALAVVSSADEFCYPCGGCLEMMHQLGSELGEFDILCAKPTGEYESRRIGELLPHPWKSSRKTQGL